MHVYLSLLHLTLPVQAKGGRLQLGAWQRDRKTRDCRKPVSVGFASRCCRMCCRYPSLAFTIAFYCFMWLSFRGVSPTYRPSSSRHSTCLLATSRCEMYEVRSSVHHRLLCALSTEIFYNQHEGGAKQFCSQKKERQAAERKRTEEEKRSEHNASNHFHFLHAPVCTELTQDEVLAARILDSNDCLIYAPPFPAPDFLGSLWAFLRLRYSKRLSW